MPHIYVSKSDLLNELEDKDLKDELFNRDINIISREDAADTLLQSADILRSQGRNDLAFRLDEIKNELLD